MLPPNGTTHEMLERIRNGKYRRIEEPYTPDLVALCEAMLSNYPPRAAPLPHTNTAKAVCAECRGALRGCAQPGAAGPLIPSCVRPAARPRWKALQEGTSCRCLVSTGASTASLSTFPCGVGLKDRQLYIQDEETKDSRKLSLDKVTGRRRGE